MTLTEDVAPLLEPLPPIELPRGDVARAAAALNLDASPGFLANHSFRSFAWGAWFGRQEGIEFDPDTLWVASVLHDIGLTDGARGEDCFEVDGAEAAAAFLREHVAPEETVEFVKRAIVLHMQPAVSRDEGAIAFLLDAGVSCDVSGRRYEELDVAFRDAVLERFPRLDFKLRFTALIAAEAGRKPDCMAARYMTEFGLPQRVLAAPFAE
jgi:hypothetical protein